MKLSSAILALCAVGLTLLIGSARADVVVLKSGARVSGEVTEGDDKVDVKTSEGTLSISKDRIERIIRGDDDSAGGEVRVGTTETPDAAGDDAGVSVKIHTAPATTRDWGEFVAEIAAARGAGKPAGPGPETMALLGKKVKLDLKKGSLAELAEALGAATDAKFAVDAAADKDAQVIERGTCEGTVGGILAQAAAASKTTCKVSADRILLGVRPVAAEEKQRKEYPEVRMGPQVITVTHRVPISARTAEVLAGRISVDFKDASLSNVVEYLHETAGANFSFRPADLEADSTAVTLRLKDVPLRDVLDMVFEGRALGWAARNDVIRIRPRGDEK